MYVQSTNLAALVIVPVYLHCKFMEIFLGFIIYFQIYFWKIKNPLKNMLYFLNTFSFYYFTSFLKCSVHMLPIDGVKNHIMELKYRFKTL